MFDSEVFFIEGSTGSHLVHPYNELCGEEKRRSVEAKESLGYQKNKVLADMDNVVLQCISSFLSLRDTLSFRSTCVSMHQNLTGITTLCSSTISNNVVDLLAHISSAGKSIRQWNRVGHSSCSRSISSPIPYQDCSSKPENRSPGDKARPSSVAINIHPEKKSKFLPYQNLNFEFLQNVDLCFDTNTFQKCSMHLLNIITIGTFENLTKLRISWYNCIIDEELNEVINQIFGGKCLPKLQELGIRGLVLSNSSIKSHGEQSKEYIGRLNNSILVEEKKRLKRNQYSLLSYTRDYEMKSLSLAACIFSTTFVSHLFDERYQNLTSLSLTNCDLAEIQLEQLSIMFASREICSRLNSLNLSHNHINDSGILHLTHAIELGWGQHLRDFDLSGNIIGDLGFIQLLNRFIPEVLIARSTTCNFDDIKDKTSYLCKKERGNNLPKTNKIHNQKYTSFRFLPRLETFRINGNSISSVGMKYFYHLFYQSLYPIQGMECLHGKVYNSWAIKNLNQMFQNERENSKIQLGITPLTLHRLEGEPRHQEFEDLQQQNSIEEKDNQVLYETLVASEKLRLAQLNFYLKKFANSVKNPMKIEESYVGEFRKAEAIIQYTKYLIQHSQSPLQFSSSQILLLPPLHHRGINTGSGETLSLKTIELAANKIDLEGVKYLHRLKCLFIELHLTERLLNLCEEKLLGESTTILDKYSPSPPTGSISETKCYKSSPSKKRSQKEKEISGLNVNKTETINQNGRFDPHPLLRRSLRRASYFSTRFSKLSMINIIQKENLPEIKAHLEESYNTETDWISVLCEKFANRDASNIDDMIEEEKNYSLKTEEIFDQTQLLRIEMEHFLLSEIVI